MVKLFIGKELEWDTATESIVLYNLGAGYPASFEFSDEFLSLYKDRFGRECPRFLPLEERIDNSNCIAIIQDLGFKKSSHQHTMLSAVVVNKDLGSHGLCIERYPDGSENVYIDENKYVVNKMLHMTATTVTPSQCVHSLLTKCRQLKVANVV